MLKAMYLLACLVVLVESMIAQELYPCNSTSSPPFLLACLSCQGSSMEECTASAEYEICSVDNSESYSCYEKRVMTVRGEMISYERGCREENSCCGSMYTKYGECTTEGKCGDAVYTCEKCFYGCTNDTYKCIEQCQEPWVSFGESCYYFSYNRAPWNYAKADCESRTATLAEVHSQNENDFLLSKLDRDTWIGLSQDDSDRPFTWVDGAQLTYSNWSFGEPDDERGIGDYAAMLPDGTWADYGNRENFEFLCQKPGVNGSCESNLWQLFDDVCYMLGQTTYRWNLANEFCADIGASMVIINSLEVNDFVKSIITGTTWIGLFQEDTDPFTWSDGSIAVYTNWDGSSPNDFVDEQDCVEIDESYGEWNDEACTDLNNWVCEKPALQIT